MGLTKSRNSPSDHAPEVGPEGFGEVRAREGHLDGGLQEAQLVAGIEAAAREANGVERSPLAQAPEGVSELDLAAVVGRRLAEDGEDVRRQDVPPDDGEVGRSR